MKRCEWIDYFANGSGRKHFERYLSRSTRFVPTELRILKENRVPKDLIFLSMIESGFNTHAYSSAAASGLWQFIRSTGRLYGLDSDYWVDERRDPEKATLAAARHLRDLYEEFGDWYLAFAAYNAGAGKVRRAIEAVGSRNFWELASTSYLRQETKDYVPKILAAAIISKSPEKYGFRDVSYQDPIATETVTVSSSTDLDVVADCAGVDTDLIRLINPELIRNVTPPNRPEYRVFLPRGTRSNFERKYAHLDSGQRLKNVRYVAQRGDTLRSIAQDHGVSVSSLINANPSLEGRNSVPSGTTLVVPKAFDSPPPVPVASAYPSTSRGKRLIDLIADKDENEIKTSKKDKKVKNQKVKSPVEEESGNDGEMKVVWKDKEKSAEPKPAPAVKKVEEEKADTVTAKNENAAEPAAKPEGESGNKASDTDQKIAEALDKVGTGDSQNADEAAQENGAIRVKPSGEDPRVALKAKTKKAEKEPAETKVSYKVKRGESLATIAEKYDVTVSELKEWNHLKGKKGLLANQRLVIYKEAPAKETSSRAPAKLAEQDGKGKRKAAEKAKPKVIAYKVRPGDTINKIAKRYELTPSEIITFNGLSKKTALKPGLVLRIPAKSSTSRG
ncbi:MAG: LysM peptidoglycan-binding domain-containing protein [bacterium]